MKDNISSTQWFAVLASSVSAVLMMNYIRLFIVEVGRGTYLSALLLAILTAVFLTVVIALQKANDFHTPIETVSSLLGRPSAILCCAVAALGFFLFTVETLNIYIYIVKFYFLPRTPTLILGAALFLPSAYMAYCGFRTFGNMASVTLLSFLIFLLMFLFTKNNYLPSNLMPWNEFEWSGIFKSLPFLFLSAPAIAAAFFILPLCSDHRRLYRKTLLFAAVFGVMMIFLYLAGMAYFGEKIIQKLILPFYNLSPFFKGNLLERFDIIYMLALLPTLGIFNAFGFSVFSLIQQDLLVSINAKRHGVTILCFALAALVLSAFTMDRLPMWTIYRYGNVIALGIAAVFALLYGAAAIKKRRSTP